MPVYPHLRGCTCHHACWRHGAQLPRGGPRVAAQHLTSSKDSKRPLCASTATYPAWAEWPRESCGRRWTMCTQKWQHHNQRLPGSLHPSPGSPQSLQSSAGRCPESPENPKNARATAAASAPLAVAGVAVAGPGMAGDFGGALVARVVRAAHGVVAARGRRGTCTRR